MKKVHIYFILFLLSIFLVWPQAIFSAYLPVNNLAPTCDCAVDCADCQVPEPIIEPATPEVIYETELSPLADNTVDSFKAQVVRVINEVKKTREDGSTYTQQDLSLRALNGPRQREEFIYYGISDIEVGNAGYYKEGQRVFVDVFRDDSGQETVYVVDFVRTIPIIILASIFIIFVLVVGHFKGFKALISLLLSFVVIIKFILPQIIAGHDPFLVSLIGGLLIMAIIIYLTEGWNKKSHLAIFSVLLSLLITLILSFLFTNLTHLTGLAQEEAIFLVGIGQAEINFRGLLLAGMLIGSIGVLDDIIFGQIEAVARIKEANHKLTPKKVFHLAYKIGNTHLGAIINTLFLTYAGAALPLLILFVVNQASGLSLARALNTEAVTTEIVRTLVGSIGVIASMPIATFLAAWHLKSPKK